MSIRIKKSRLHGKNRTMSYSRMMKNPISKFYRVVRKPLRYKGITNTTMISPLSYRFKRYRRLRKLKTNHLHNRMYWKCRYPGINAKHIRMDRKNRLREQHLNGKSLLWKLETRLDVLLWRSGFVTSVSMGKHLVSTGCVEYYSKGEWHVANHSYKRLDIGEVLKVTNWSTMVGSVSKIRSTYKYYYKIPPYILVNYKLGRITLIHNPIDGEVMIPSHLPIRLTSLNRIN